MDLNFYPSVWTELQAADTELRATCKAHLIRLREREFRAIRLEKVTDSLWELKISWAKQEFRFLFFYGSQAANLVHFFQKKTRKTPPNELSLATQRMKEMKLDQAIGVHGIPH
jgi:phage-related protein